MEFPLNLRTGRLLLTRLERADWSDYLRMRSAPEVARILGPMDCDKAAMLCQRLAEQWEEQGYGWWAMRDPKSGKFLGCGGLRSAVLEGTQATEVAYGLLPEFWGRGYASELVRTAVAQGFVRLGVQEIVSYVLPDNIASRRVVEKSGFVCERSLEHAKRPHLLYKLKARHWCAAPASRAGAQHDPMLQTA
jgi:RimJ/RimL family protein N-acetyltransferase